MRGIEQVGSSDRRFILGIDLGVNSVGWALLDALGGQPRGIAAAGSRIFEAGTEGDIASGRDESRNLKRRQARLARRLLWRRARRLRTLFHTLQAAGLLPAGAGSDSQSRHEILNALDKDLGERLRESVDSKLEEARRSAHLIPYLLRTRALDKRLEPYELGRALYQLGQRRGFQSNRRSGRASDEKEQGPVEEGIDSLRKEMAASSARTLGEHFAHLDPEERRIRGRWTARAMYREEFEAIWNGQARFHPAILTDSLRKALAALVLEQRPLRAQSHLIGTCDLHPAKRRAPWALPDAQRFRLLQRVNDLEVTTPFPEGEVRRLDDRERATLIQALEERGDLTFAQIRTLLGFTRNHTFNLEQGGEKKLPGNRTNARLAAPAVFGTKWWALDPAQRTRIVEEWLSTQKDGLLARRAKETWGLGEDAALNFGKVVLEPGYCNLSRAALRTVVPRMEQGERFSTIRRDLFPSRYESGAEATALPSAPRLRNPVVERALTELRKVVNAIVRNHGKPAIIRVELTRDLQRTRKKRLALSKEIRRRETERDAARRRIVEEAGVQEPTGADIEKARLWEECRGICPYTGRAINFASLFGPEPEFDVEHILPRSRSLDNSFLNKTLCNVAENRNRKRNQTPFEAYSGDPARCKEVLQRVRAFQGPAAREKLRRFMLSPADVEKEFLDFSNRQLSDTRYASRAAAEYLGTLYGGKVDADGTLRVQVGSGQVTALLRSVWGLNSILSDGPRKERTDHRHHTVDAVCIALTSPASLKALSEAAYRGEAVGRRGFASVSLPWEGFWEEVQRVVDGVVVSHAVKRKVNGPLHEETLYPPEQNDGTRHVRKPVESLSVAAIEADDAIVDPAVRKAIRLRLEELGGDPRAFQDPENHPFLRGRDGRRIPIRKVSVREKVAAQRVGTGHRERFVKTGSNHHVAIRETVGPGGKPSWRGEVVTRFEAMRRLRAKEPVIRAESSEGGKFLFSLSQGEAVQMEHEGAVGLFVLGGVSEDQAGTVILEFRRNRDARPVTELRKIRGGRVRKTPGSLQSAKATKVLIDPLGNLRRAHD